MSLKDGARLRRRCMLGGTFACASSKGPDPQMPLSARRHVVETVIDVREDEDASHSEVFIQTRDRPGLLTDIVHTLKDINVNVVSAEARRLAPAALLVADIQTPWGEHETLTQLGSVEAWLAVQGTAVGDGAVPVCAPSREAPLLQGTAHHAMPGAGG